MKLASMSTRTFGGTRFTLSAPSAALTVDVELRCHADRWIAVAAIAGRRQVGIGAKPREALTAALGSLDQADRVAMLADLVLLGPSVELLRATADAGG